MALEGFKYWADGEPVTGVDANTFLMSQSVMRFDDASDRDSALARTLTTGMVAYLKDTTTLQIYDGTAWVDVALGTTGVTDHGALTGLGDDDHTQYHNDVRGDARYYTQSQVDSSLSGKSDTSHAHSYLPLSGGTLTGGLTVSGDLTYENNAIIASNASSSNIDHIWHDDGSNAWNFCSDTSYKAAGNSTLVAGAVSTSGDISVGGRLSIGGHYIDDVAGTGNPYGSINVGGAMTWDGYAIDNRVVFMHDGSSAWGIYNDTNNHWMIYGLQNGGVELKHANVTRIATDPTYGLVSYGAGGYTQIGSANGSWSHFITDRPAYYFNKRITVDEGVVSSYNEDLVLQRAGNNGIRLASAVAYHYYESKFQYTSTSNDWSAQPVQIDSTYDSGYASRWGNTDSNTGQLRPAAGAWYVRNHNDGAYWYINAIISNQSSYRMKQDIETWGYSKPLSSAVNATYDTTATDLVRQLRPVSYRFNKQDRLPRDLPNERRQEALDRLNRIRLSKGLKQFDSEEAIHECGRDCEHTVDDPCSMYRQWERGTIGFIAEEVGEVIPEATDMDLRPRSTTQGENTAIDGLAITAILTKALQEMDARITELEMTA